MLPQSRRMDRWFSTVRCYSALSRSLGRQQSHLLNFLVKVARHSLGQLNTLSLCLSRLGAELASTRILNRSNLNIFLYTVNSSSRRLAHTSRIQVWVVLCLTRKSLPQSFDGFWCATHFYGLNLRQTLSFFPRSSVTRSADFEGDWHCHELF